MDNLNNNNKKSKLKKVAKYFIFIALLLIAINIINQKNGNDKITSPGMSHKIDVIVTRESTNGIIEKDFKNPYILKLLRENGIKRLKKICRETFHNKGIKEEFDIKIESDSWCVTKNNKNFIIEKIQIGNMVNATSIIGIKGNVLVKISGMKEGINPVPHSYGPCAKKMKEIFGFNLSNK